MHTEIDKAAGLIPDYYNYVGLNFVRYRGYNVIQTESN